LDRYCASQHIDGAIGEIARDHEGEEMTLGQLRIPDHETVVEIPAELLKYFPKD
jgi:hypothetical protein